jgi:FKBP-type peptidyl-prolyl cis-trans isomerase SlpA
MRIHDVIVPGSKVRMHFSLQLDDGTLVESSMGGEPIEFEMGDGTLIAGLERALYGLKSGDQQTIRIGPEEGYGVRDPAHVHELRRADFPADFPVEPGLVVGFDLPSGEQVPGTIVAVHADTVRVDFNHPLAGREVIFAVEVLEVQTVVANEDETPPPEF